MLPLLEGLLVYQHSILISLPPCLHSSRELLQPASMERTTAPGRQMRLQLPSC